MKKIEIERMQRLEEMIASRDQEIHKLVQANKSLSIYVTKPRANGEAAVRYQVHYNNEGSFTGVAYTPLSAFKETP